MASTLINVGTVHGVPVSGTNTIAPAVTFQGGISTGSAVPSDVNLATTVTGASGTTPQVSLNKFMIHNKVYSMPDNVGVDIFSVDLPTSNTGASVHLSFTYNVTNGSNAGSHCGIYVVSFCNNGGTVTGNATDAAEAVSGTGAGASIDHGVVNVVGTVGTFNLKFNNTLSATGTLTVQCLNNSATTFAWL